MRIRRMAFFGLCALVGCQAPSPTAAAEALRDAAHSRGQTAAAMPPATTDPAIADEVRELLRQPLTDDDAVRIALLHNHRVRGVYERLGIASADLVQAGLLRNPVFDGAARFLLDGGTELELGLAMPFVDLFYRPLRAKMASHVFAAAQARLTDELVRLVFAVRGAAVSHRAAQRLRDLQREHLRAAEAAHELAVALHAAGNLTDQAVALARVDESRARLDLATAELAAREAKEPLQRWLGLWGAHTEWTLAGELADDPLQGIDLQHVESRAIKGSLALAAHRAQLDALAQQTGLRSWQQWFPDGEAGITALREPGGEWGFGPQIAVELPLFDSGSTARTRSEHQLQAGMHEYVQLAVEIRSTARLLRARAELHAERARFLRDIHLPHRAEALRTTMQTYNAMQIGVFDVLAQRRQQLADQQEHVRTLRSAHLARLDLQQLLAGSLPQLAANSPTAPAAAEPANQRHETSARGQE